MFVSMFWSQIERCQLLNAEVSLSNVIVVHQTFCFALQCNCPRFQHVAMAREFQYKLGILGRDVGGHVVHDALSPVKTPCLHQFDEGTLIH
jgi:hypothetical protein